MVIRNGNVYRNLRLKGNVKKYWNVLKSLFSKSINVKFLKWENIVKLFNKVRIYL